MSRAARQVTRAVGVGNTSSTPPPCRICPLAGQTLLTASEFSVVALRAGARRTSRRVAVTGHLSTHVRVARRAASRALPLSNSAARTCCVPLRCELVS